MLFAWCMFRHLSECVLMLCAQTRSVCVYVCELSACVFMLLCLRVEKREWKRERESKSEIERKEEAENECISQGSAVILIKNKLLMLRRDSCATATCTHTHTRSRSHTHTYMHAHYPLGILSTWHRQGRRGSGRDTPPLGLNREERG